MKKRDYNIKDMVKEWLAQNDFDGLYSDECGCSKEDLMPCEKFCEFGDFSCKPGYMHGPMPIHGFDFQIKPEKP